MTATSRYCRWCVQWIGRGKNNLCLKWGKKPKETTYAAWL
jgi:hypothetical protein